MCSGLSLRVCSLFLALAIGVPTLAQNITVSGTVRDTAGNPVVGASIVDVNNPVTGTSAGLDGSFTLSADPNAVLEVSFIGYRTQQIPLNNRTQLAIVLEEDTAQIDEVVVIGYGTMRKTDLTGSVASVGKKDFGDTPVANVGQAIQGKISGVQIVDSGKPGDNVTIKIRGLGTINDSDPLVVIDGVPTDLGLTSLNMADIERIDVLNPVRWISVRRNETANLVGTCDSRSSIRHPEVFDGLGAQLIKSAPSGGIILMDEPTAHLDRDTARRVWDEVFASRKGAIATVHEYEDVLQRYAPRVESIPQRK